jgi:RNA polymerase-binding transcription factor DksA
MAKKKEKKAKKSAPKTAKKASKPAAKKSANKTAPKKAKPVAKKAAPKPKAKKAAVTNKPQKTKKAEVKKTVKKEVKKIVSKKEDPKLKKAAVVVKPTSAKDKKSLLKLSKDEKKSKPADADLEGEGLDVDAALLEMEPVEGADDDDELIEEVVEKPKKGRGRGRNKREGKKHYDSEDYVRKQVVKIDLTKPLIKRPKKIEPEPYVNNKDKRSRYSDKELGEFKEILLTKLQEAKVDYELLKQTLTNADNHGTDDTSPTFKLLEDGSDMLSKEEVAQLASRQEKYIVNLQNALIRIQNKTYGICRVTGKLIPKERLRSVPHATLSIDAKLSQYN